MHEDFFIARTNTGHYAFFCIRLAFVIFLISGTAHRVAIISTIDLFWILSFVGALLAIGFILAIYALFLLWEDGIKGAKPAAYAILLGIVTASPFFASAVYALSLPPLYDISTDLPNPPPFYHAPNKRSAEMNEIHDPLPDEIALQKSAYPHISGRRYAQAPDQIAASVEHLAHSYGWQEIAKSGSLDTGSEMVIEALAHTQWLGFGIDIAVRITDEGETTYLDIRSSSRYGAHDLGDNAKRIERFFVDLNQQIIRSSVHEDTL